MSINEVKGLVDPLRLIHSTFGVLAGHGENQLRSGRGVVFSDKLS